MRFHMLILTIVIYFQLSEQQDDEETINYEASTSREYQREELERCEIRGYARRFVLLLISEDSNRADLKDVMANQYHELKAFYNDAFSNIMVARYGAQYIDNPNRRQNRLRLFNYYVNLMLIEVYNEVCSRSYHQNLLQRYDRELNRIIVEENITYEPYNCSCGNYMERSVLSLPFSIPRGLYEPSTTFQLEIGRNREMRTREVAEYHIIPPQLISRFLEVWLSNGSINLPNFRYSECTRTLLGRLKRSLQKLFLASIEKPLDDPMDVDVEPDPDSYLVRIVERSHGMLSGNIYLGPFDRGPFSPSFDRSGERLLQAFDFGARYIIGSSRHKLLLTLYYKLLDYIKNAHRANPMLRLLNGLNIFLALQITMYEQDIVPMNDTQWEQRRPTNLDLIGIGTEELREMLKTRTFWDIRKPNGRNRRSMDYGDRKSNAPSFTVKSCSKENYLKQQWSMFILDVMTIYLEANAKDENLSWSCNFTILYNDYAFRKSANKSGNSCVTFDKFLFSKISSSVDWNDCQDWRKPRLEKQEWCLAWRRIMKNLDAEVTDFNSDFPKMRIYKPRSESYLRDMETFLLWLTSENRKKDSKVNGYIEFPDNFHKTLKRLDGLEDSLFLIHTIKNVIMS